MQLPVLSLRGQKKPWPSVPRINWQHPLAKGLVFYAYDTGSGLVVDLVQGLRGTNSAAFGPTTSPQGSGQRYTSGGPRLTFPNSGNVVKIFPASQYSQAAAWYITALPSITFTQPFSICDSSANLAAGIVWDQSATNDLQWQIANLSGVIFSGNSINVFHSFVGTNTAAAAQNIYFDGKLATTSALTSAFTATAYQPQMNGGQIGAAANNSVAGQVFYGALWNRTITAIEAAQIHYDPWCFLIYPEDDIFAELVNPASAAAVTSSWGFEQANESNVFRTYSYQRGLIVPKEDGIISPFVNWQNVGSEIQPPPPPHIFRERRGAIVPKGDGNEAPFINWFNAGWEIQAFQPAHQFRERRGAVVPKEDGAEFTEIAWFNFGWEIQSVQPPIPWKFKAWSGATARGDDGSEARLVNFFPAGWEIQAVQPPHPFWEKRGSIMPREDGHESPLINFFPAGWEVQSIQPGHPRRERSGSIARGDDGSEATLINFYPTAWDQIGHWKYVRTREAMFGEDGTEFPLVTQVVTITSGWGFDLQPYQPQYLRHPSGAIARIEDGNESPLVNFFPFNWEVQPPPPPHPRPERFGSLVRGDDGSEASFVNWYNFGFEIQSVQPPSLRFSQRFGGLARGSEDGTENTFSNWYNAGWEVQSVQPPHQRPERFGSQVGPVNIEVTFTNFYPAGWEIQPALPRHIFNKQFLAPEDGTEAAFIPPPTSVSWGFDAWQPQPNHPRPERWAALSGGDSGHQFQLVGWYNFGWEIYPVQPKAFRTKPGIMPWEDGTDLNQIGWFNVGWETQSVQPPHPRPERFGAMAPWEDGIEGVYIFVPPPANNSVFRPLMGVGI